MEDRTNAPDNSEQAKTSLAAREAEKAFILGDGDLTALLKDRTLFNGKNRLDLLISRLGPKELKEFANNLLDSRIREASTTLKDGEEVIGIVRPEEVLAWYNELKAIPGTDRLFQLDAETSARYAKTIADLENVASVKKMIKVGIVTAILVLLVLAFVAFVFVMKRHG
jgi:hypothetical protein